MPVFVDTMRHPFGRMIMCHMFADTDAELHEMARRIGIARRWHQRPDCPFIGYCKPTCHECIGMTASWSHYDICQTKRAKAIGLGAVEIAYRDLPKWLEERGRR